MPFEMGYHMKSEHWCVALELKSSEVADLFGSQHRSFFSTQTTQLCKSKQMPHTNNKKYFLCDKLVLIIEVFVNKAHGCHTMALFFSEAQSPKLKVHDD